MWAVLDLAHAVADGLDEVLGGGEGGVGQPVASQQGPDALDRVEVGCVGGQLVDGQLVLPGDELPDAVSEMDVEVDAPMYCQPVPGAGCGSETARMYW